MLKKEIEEDEYKILEEEEEANNVEAEAEPQGGVSLICLTKCATSFGTGAAGFRTYTTECLTEEIQGERSVDLVCNAKCAAGFGADDEAYKKCVLECSTKGTGEEGAQAGGAEGKESGVVPKIG